MSELSITPVILCGGAGSRLWPMSRDEKPKQFHALFNDRSLLTNTASRIPVGIHNGLAVAPPIVLGNAQLEQMFHGALKEFETQPSNILLEPSVRDTAAAIAAVTAFVAARDKDQLVVVLPSDARIDNHEVFLDAIAKAARTASKTDAIMTLGIAPSRPETQYGYIQQGEAFEEGFRVEKFREKPDYTTAQKYVAEGNFLWNAGMFLVRVGRMVEEFERLQPEIWEKAKNAVELAETDGPFVFLDHDNFNIAPKLSMDYAIMEKADNIGVIPASFDWDDLGSWTQLYEAASKDGDGNALYGDVINIEAKNNYVRADDALVAIAGVEGLTVIAEDNKVLVARTEKAHLVKDVTTVFKADYAYTRKRHWPKKEIQQWLFEKALPLWAEKGIDYENGGVHEALTFDAEPAPHMQKRLRVIARQIYCFSHASLLGWKGDSDKILRHCFDTLINTGWHEDGGFIHLYNPDGTVLDDTRDTYDQCFVLLGLSWLYRAKAWPEAREWADKTLAYMDNQLADTVNGGYFEDSKGSLPRRANPHMHFLEAMLGWYDATGDKRFLDRAQAMVQLFERYYYDRISGTVTERFNNDWSAIAKGDADLSVEPGHSYEWAWLLMRYNSHRSTPRLEAKARAIYAAARAFGHHEQTGAAADYMQPDGTGVSDNARCWPQTEALKAAIIFEKNGLSVAASHRKMMLDVLLTRYLNGPIDGGWYDAINTEGRVTAPDMPSSTFYHVFCALAEHIER
jgi:mannose-1-phosphate guanylyltransferase/mannose-6-phosphate isomerase